MNDEAQREAILSSIVERLNHHGWTGKTQVQKVVFFAQEAAKLDLGFRYVIHHYGPYSFELNSFMQFLQTRGTLEISRENDGYGYQIKLADPAGTNSFPQEIERKLHKIDQYLGGVSTNDLELLSTCLYISRRFPGRPLGELIQEVHALKPKFTEQQIARGFTESEDIASQLEAA